MRQYKVLIYVISVLIGMTYVLASCGEGKSSLLTESPMCHATKVNLPLGEEEIVLDVMEEEGGFVLLYGTPADIGEYGWEDSEDASRIWYRSSLTHYDGNWVEDVSKREELEGDLRFARLIDIFGGETCCYAARPEWRTEEDDKAAYVMGIDMAVFKNGTFWCNVGYGAGGETHSAGMRRAQYYIKDGDIFAVTMAGDAEIGGKEMLFIAKGDSSLTEARRVSLPKDEDLSVAGVGELEGETVLLASAEEKSGAMGAEKKEGYGLIIPIDRDTIKLDLTDSRRIDVSPTGGVASKDGLLLFMSGAELYITDGKDTKRLANIEEAGFNAASRVSRIRPLEDGRILMVVENQLVELSPTEEGTIPETKTITLTLAVRGGLTDEAQELIGRFNRAQKDIVVETKSCRDVAALNLALLGHEVDLISETDLLLMRNYTEKGRLVSFDEVCPAVLEEGKLLSNIVEATKVEGKVAFLPRSFSVGGYFTAEEALTDSEDLADLWEKAAAADPVLPKTYPDSLWVRDVAARNADEWIDWETRTCYFDNGSFESLIVFAQKCSHADEEALAHAEYERHLGMVHIGNPLNAGGEERILFALPLEKDDGWEIEPDTFYAVAAGGNTEAARKFMEFIFLESSEGEKNARYFPVNSAALEAYLTPVREEDQPEEVFEETKKTFAAVRALVINADHYGYFENALTEIITEEVTNCLSGNITAEKAAEYIQNRVQLYLDEQG